MNTELRIALAQINLLVGDIEGNTQKVIAYCEKARNEMQADVIVFPELTLTSYPPEDLLLRPELYDRVNAALKKIQQAVHGIDVIVGYPEKMQENIYNTIGFLQNGKWVARYQKQYLPNYSVFYEKRYFTAGKAEATIVQIKGVPVALNICEDIWFPEPMQQAAHANAKLMITTNASPFEMYKPQIRQEILEQRVAESGIPIVYANLVGGQDELVFDGGSLYCDAQGKITYTSAYFKETLALLEFKIDSKHNLQLLNPNSATIHSTEERVYQALVLGVRDYIQKNNFPGAILGLSGGIDSALTLAIAVDAIGKDKIEAVYMPSRYSSDLSWQGALEEAKNVDIKLHEINIEPVFEAFLTTLEKAFQHPVEGVTAENLQARCRGMLLMALSNQSGKIVLSTGNKSEMSVGYSTLYGDMAGGFCVLKDVPKTLVYRLAAYRNTLSPIIPEKVLHRPASAELSPNQSTEKFLAPFKILDEILERYIEKDQSEQEIIAAGLDEKTVKRIIGLIQRNEYKRRQAPLGIKVTPRAFGYDRRYPITSGFVKK